MIRYNGPDGRVFESEHAVAAADLFKEWGVKDALGAFVDGAELDLFRTIDGGGTVLPIIADSPEGLELIRHSCSHLLAQAITRLWPGAHFGVGPSIKDGFYYDVEFPTPISEDDLAKIEAEMKKIVKERERVVRHDVSIDDALARFKDDRFKVELISDLRDKGETGVSLYEQGEFCDLCRGPHVPNTGYIKHFKLLSLAGAYWRGDEHNAMLTRVYGTAFPTGEELDAYVKRMEEARARDHRKLGRELDLFSFQPEGPGFPFFHPKGMALMNKLIDYWRHEHKAAGYNEIRTPQILDRELWVRSGHMDHYSENMYFTEIDEHPYAIKPMNCPGGILVYKTAIRSYRDLPLRMGELGIVHRHERSGVLHGLMRVRCFTQDDAHIYCTPDQVGAELKGVMNLAKRVYDVFGFKFTVELSTRPENSMGDDALWELAEKKLQEALEETGLEYRINPGDGAFYGPKIDYHLEDSIGRTWQCGTLQLDFQLPEKFDMTYIGSDGAEHRPVMLHRTILGSLERFIGILVEHYAGAFPFWIAPVQVKIIQVKPDHAGHADKVEAMLRDAGVRTSRDARDEKLGRKIRDAQLEKVPVMLIIGEKECEADTVSIRSREEGDIGSRTLDELMRFIDELPDPMKDKR